MAKFTNLENPHITGLSADVMPQDPMSSTKLGITVGLEFEIDSISPSLSKRVGGERVLTALGLEYYGELQKAKEAKIINELRIEEFFPEESKAHEFLAIIKKINSEGKARDFLGVTFDDNSVMGQLEFISIGNGILSADEFFKEKNLSEIKNAIDGFREEILSNTGDISQLSFASKGITGQASQTVDYKIDIPEIGIKILKNIQDTKGGAVHVTHTFPVDLIENEMICSQFIEKSYNNGKTQSARESFLQGRGNNLDVLQTSNRTNYAPNPKTPLEFFQALSGELSIKESLNPSEKYALDWKENKVLYPMGNTSINIKEDLKLYNNLLQKVSDLLGTPAEDSSLTVVQTKLKATIDGLESVKKFATNKRIQNKYSSLAPNLQKRFVKKDELLLFQSYEEKLQPFVDSGKAFLVEHRSEQQCFAGLCSKYFKNGVYNQAQYDTAIEVLKEIDIKKPSTRNFGFETIPSSLQPTKKTAKNVNLKRLQDSNVNYNHSLSASTEPDLQVETRIGIVKEKKEQIEANISKFGEFKTVDVQRISRAEQKMKNLEVFKRNSVKVGTSGSSPPIPNAKKKDVENDRTM